MASKMPTRVLDRMHGGWKEVHWSDGTEQWCHHPPRPAHLYIERVVGRTSRRKRWYVVNRYDSLASGLGPLDGSEKFVTSKYPPVVSGPFDDLQGAKAALLILLTIQG